MMRLCSTATLMDMLCVQCVCTLYEARDSQQELCKWQATLPAHQACMLQSVPILPTDTCHMCHQPNVQLGALCHLPAHIQQTPEQVILSAASVHIRLSTSRTSWHLHQTCITNTTSCCQLLEAQRSIVACTQAIPCHVCYPGTAFMLKFQRRGGALYCSCCGLENHVSPWGALLLPCITQLKRNAIS